MFPTAQTRDKFNHVVSGQRPALHPRQHVLLLLHRIEVATDSGAIIGFSRYSDRDVPAHEMEIGWTFLARSHWGGAFNRDMKQMMLAHLLASYPRAIFRIGEGNLRSRRAIVKIGGEPLDWDITLDVMGRQVRYVAYQITRAAFAEHFSAV